MEAADTEEAATREFQVPNAPEDLEQGEEPLARDLLAAEGDEEADGDRRAALQAMVEGARPARPRSRRRR